MITVRDIFFNIRIFKSKEFSKPIISAGNISTGGTGKTPFVLYLAEFYLSKGFRIGIVTRGYKGKAKGLLLVSDGKQIFHDSEISGDEAIMISAKLIENYSNFSICTSKKRKKGVTFLIDNFNPDIIILDDAFQYRWVKRNLDIVMIDSLNCNKMNEKILLPSGNLRETKYSLNRTDLIIINDKFSNNLNVERLKDKFEKYSKPLIHIGYKLELDNSDNCKIENLLNKEVIVFCGIADPDSFIELVKNKGLNIKQSLIFGDHHRYKISDIELLSRIYEKNDIFLTTEKDFTKIKGYQAFCNKYPICFFRIGIEILDNRKLLEDKLASLINN